VLVGQLLQQPGEGGRIHARAGFAHADLIRGDALDAVPRDGAAADVLKLPADPSVPVAGVGGHGNANEECGPLIQTQHRMRIISRGRDDVLDGSNFRIEAGIGSAMDPAADSMHLQLQLRQGPSDPGSGDTSTRFAPFWARRAWVHKP
jgi:hypothetical protein